MKAGDFVLKNSGTGSLPARRGLYRNRTQGKETFEGASIRGRKRKDTAGSKVFCKPEP
jgi:hypothetical protein